MEDSILHTIKALRGVSDDDTAFDSELIVNINTALMVLEQAGVGAPDFHITGPQECWSDFLPEGSALEAVKSFVDQKVHVLFDPPQNGTLMNALESSLNETLWRLYTELD